MYFHGRDGDRLDGVEERDARMRIRARVDDDSVRFPVRSLDPVDQIPFVVRLVQFDLNAALFRVFPDRGAEGIVILLAVNRRLADPEHIDVRSVDYQDLHFTSSRIMYAVSFAFRPDLICRSHAAR